MKAIAVSPGLAVGRALKIPAQVGLDHVTRDIKDTEFEIQNLRDALQKSQSEMNEIISHFRKAKQKDQVEIFEAHAMMIDDPELVDRAIEIIHNRQIAAAWAYKESSDEYVRMLSSLEDEYLRERATDVRDIASRVIDHLLGVKRFDFKKVAANTILIGDDITPSQMAMIDPKLVTGIITEMGGKTSHTAIIARALEIPAVAGARGILGQVRDNSLILLDAIKGEITIDPSADKVAAFEDKKKDLSETKKDLLRFKGVKSTTKDNRELRLGANIGGPLDIPSLIENDAEAVGLYRTEFVFLNANRIPTVDEQYKVYRQVFEALGTKHCIIRTLDIGGDKKLEGLSIADEMNPFLGLRGVRLCLEERTLFKDQLKSILRAAAGHSVGIMVPMISNIEEILQTKVILEECKTELDREKVDYSKDFEFGVMIEVPSAAMIVDLIARHVDFISIGTNDLTQYVCAVDRLNDKVEALYDPYNPGFLRVMNQVLSSAYKAKLHSGICGSLAHAELLVPLFIGMGVDELSMTSQHILSTRKLVNSLTFSECQKLVEQVMNLETSAEVKKHLEAWAGIEV